MSRFHVAISFAGPQRSFAQDLNRNLQSRGVATFYDYDFRAELLGAFLPAKFHEVFGSEADYVAVLISKDYKDRVWPRHESQIIIDKMINSKKDFILPIRFDDSIVPGVVGSIGHADARTQTAAEIANIIADKLGAPALAKLSHAPPPHHTNLFGTLEFDYSSYNGEYILGDGGLQFKTKWSSSGNDSIVAYNDAHGIVGVAVAAGAKDISDIRDADSYDYTSRTCRPHTGEWVIYKNSNGAFCAINLVEVRARSHGHAADYAKMQYVIAPDGSGDFGAFSEPRS